MDAKLIAGVGAGVLFIANANAKKNKRKMPQMKATDEHLEPDVPEVIRDIDESPEKVKLSAQDLELKEKQKQPQKMKSPTSNIESCTFESIKSSLYPQFKIIESGRYSHWPQDVLKSGLRPPNKKVGVDFLIVKNSYNSAKKKYQELKKRLDTNATGPSVSQDILNLSKKALNAMKSDVDPWNRNVMTDARYTKEWKDFLTKLEDIQKEYRSVWDKEKRMWIAKQGKSQQALNLINSTISNFKKWSQGKMPIIYDWQGGSNKDTIKFAKPYMGDRIAALEDRIKKVSKTNIADLKADMMDSKEIVEQYEHVVDFYEQLISNEFDKKFYVKVICSKYDPDLINDLKEEVEQAKTSYMENEVRPLRQKKWKTINIKTPLQFEYALTRSFYDYKIDLLNSIIEKKEAYRYTEKGKFKLSKLKKQGFVDEYEIPASFIRWANIKFKKGGLELAVITLEELQKELISIKNPRRQYDFLEAVRPLLERFKFEYQKVKSENPLLAKQNSPYRSISKFNQNPKLSTLKSIARDIKTKESAYGSNVFMLKIEYVPIEWYVYHNKNRDDKFSVPGMLPKKTRDKMLEILAQKEDEFLKVYPDSGVTFDMIRNRAYYYKELEPLNKDYAKFFKTLKEKKQNEWFEARIEAADIVDGPGKDEVMDEIDAIKDQLEVIEELRLKNLTLPFIDSAERFFYEEDETKSDEAQQRALIQKSIELSANLRKGKKSLPKSEHFRIDVKANFLEKVTVKYLEKALKIKKSVYAYMNGEGARAFKRKQMKESIKFTRDQIDKGKYQIPDEYLRYPEGQMNFSRILDTDKLMFFTNSKKNPLSKDDVFMLLTQFQGFPMSEAKYIDLYVKIGKKIAAIYSLSDYDRKELAYYRYLYYLLMKNFRVDFDIRSMIEIEAVGGRAKDVDTGKVFEKIKRIRAYLGYAKYNPMFLWDAVITNNGANFIQPQYMLNKSWYNEHEWQILNHYYLYGPDIRYIFSYASKNNLMPVEAVNDIDYVYRSYIRFLRQRATNNPEFGLDNYNDLSPKPVDSFRRWSNLKFNIIDKQKSTLDEVFSELVDYLKYYEKHGTDKGWSGKYSHMFKQHSDRNKLNGMGRPIFMGYYSNGSTMDGFFSKIVKTITKPVKKIVRVVSPLTGDLIEEELLSPLEKFLIETTEGAAKMFKKGVYKVIPPKFFDSLKNIAKIPEHLAKGNFDKVDFRQVIRDALVIGTGGAVTDRITNMWAVEVREHIAERSSFVRDLDRYSGGLITSMNNLQRMQSEIAEGKKVDRAYVIMRSLDAMKVYGAATAGGSVIAANVATNIAAEKTSLGKSSIGRSALKVTSTAIAAYSGSDVGFQEAVAQAAEKQARAEAVRIGSRETASETGLDKTELGRAAVDIGISSTVDSIGNNQTFSKLVKERAKVKALEVAEREADEKLALIDDRLTVSRIKKLYELKDKDLGKIVTDAREKFEQDLKSGVLKEKAQKEADRFLEREVKERFQGELEKYGDKMLKYLMNKYGPHWDYSRFITPEDYMAYQEWYVVYSQAPQKPRLFRFEYRQPVKKILAIGGGVAAAAVGLMFVMGDE